MLNKIVKKIENKSETQCPRCLNNSLIICQNQKPVEVYCFNRECDYFKIAPTLKECLKIPKSMKPFVQSKSLIAPISDEVFI